MSVQNPDKVVTKQDLADFYEALLPYLGGNLPVLGEISRSDIWSTTEKIVGCSTDGKPIYQKTIVDNIGSISNYASKVVTVATIANLDVLLDVTGAVKWVDGSSVGWVPFNYTNYNAPASGNIPAGSIYTTSVFYTDGNIVYLRTGGSLGGLFNNQPYIATLRYTKTTDAANSFNYASENDYSTSETIVGKWLNGETLYQRTFTGNLSSDGKATLMSNFSGKVVNISGYVHGSSGSDSFDLMIPSTGTIPSTNAVNYTSCIYVQNSKCELVVSGGLIGYFNSTPYYVTLQYTKS